MGTAQVQGALWSAAAEDWSELTEPGQIPFYEAAFDALAIGTGTRLLDAGCGSGLALLLASRRGAIPAGLDAAEGLLAVARTRLPDADLRLGDLEELPFAASSFDAVTAFNAVQYAAEPVNAVRELQRVARPGAGVAIVTWGRAEDCEMSAVLGAIGALLPPPPPGAGGPFALSAPGALEELAESAGLAVERVLDVPTPYRYPDLETAVRAQAASGPARRAVEHAGAVAVDDALAGAIRPYAAGDGSVNLDNVFRVLVARTS